MRRGEVWWADLPRPTGKRPVLLLSRDKAIQVRELITVAQVTTVVRHLPTEVSLGKEEGMPRVCVVNCDVLNTIPKMFLVEKICVLSDEKMNVIGQAIKFAIGLE